MKPPGPCISKGMMFCRVAKISSCNLELIFCCCNLEYSNDFNKMVERVSNIEDEDMGVMDVTEVEEGDSSKIEEPLE